MRTVAMFAIALALLGNCGRARADIIYRFSGTCTSGALACDLTGQGPDEIHLVDSFVAGSIIGPSDVISLSIDGWSSHGFVDTAPPNGTNVCGFPTSTACSGQVLGLVLATTPGYFTSNADGTWRSRCWAHISHTAEPMRPGQRSTRYHYPRPRSCCSVRSAVCACCAGNASRKDGAKRSSDRDPALSK